MYQLYETTLSSLLEHHPDLVVNFKQSVFGAIGFNVGPRTVTFPHSDHLNLAGGWCVITPLGNFNSKTGGHIILRQLGIAVELPPGSSIAITSAIVEHFNTDIGIDETRMSITQFTPAGLFRWVDNDFRTNKDIAELSTLTDTRDRETKDKTRYQDSLHRFSTFGEWSVI